MYDYLIPRNDGSIIVGGAKQDFWKDRGNWYGVSDDASLIEPAKHYFDGLMQRRFLGWEDSEAYTDKVWTGSKFFFSCFFCVQRLAGYFMLICQQSWAIARITCLM